MQQGYRALYRETHIFLKELAEATLAETRKDYLAELTLLIDDLAMRKLPHTTAEHLLELIMRRYERASTILSSNRPVEDWGKLLGDTAIVRGVGVERCARRSTKAGARTPATRRIRC